MAKTTSIEMNSSSTVCRWCGTAYGKLSGYFYKSYAKLWKGNGYLPVCKDCLDRLFKQYVLDCGDEKLAVQRICRNLNIYWNETVYNQVLRRDTPRTMLAGYLASINAYKYVGKSYDDTLEESGNLYNFEFIKADDVTKVDEPPKEESPAQKVDDDEDIKVSDDVRSRWGPGYSNRMYNNLEERFKYWVKNLTAEGVDTSGVGIQALLRQIAAMELDINRGRSAGEDVDKKVNTFNTLVGSAMLKPSQGKQSSDDPAIDSTPLGVWTYKFEHYRPCPDIDDSLKDRNGILRTVHTWLFGHLGKMINLKNFYTKLYEDAIADLRVEKPEYEDEDDDTVITDFLSGSGDDKGDII